ncbi:DDB1- and CUL4-associated factor 11 isoform 1 [Schistosoma japonicum]|uniref:DDB1-and CUL4-associated factor 11 isoform 1 n=3 Tax=Schistosoma japonicum TaxID=6182 RepID=A0A4Z2DHP5_SCHJA|nr:DDB1- and CUL4-associated factor 11 isoform 1 [Schistosoma japonicum]
MQLDFNGYGDPFDTRKLKIINEINNISFKGNNFSNAFKSYFQGQTIPNEVSWSLECYNDVYCGVYDSSGDLFYTASQDGVVRIFDSSGHYLRFVNETDVVAYTWSIVSLSLSKSGRGLVFCSLSTCLYFTILTDINEELDVKPIELQPGDRSITKTFSVDFLNDSNQVISGHNKGMVYVTDLQTTKYYSFPVSARSKADVNAVTTLDRSGNLILAAGDDTNIRLFDIRELNKGCRSVFSGHLDGITYLDSKGDDIYFLSNCKDQTVKLWDARKCQQPGKETRMTPRSTWDYRLHPIPRGYPVPAKQNPTKSIRGDNSVLTLTGHKVRNTLIRARFSPSFNTGQRFAYSGSAYGDWYIWDLYSGNVVKHYSCGGHTVRDVNWHPYDQQIITCGTTGDLSCWVYNQNKVPHKRKSSRNKNNCKFANSMPTVEANEETLFELRKLAKAGLKYRAQGIFEHHKSSILSRFVGHSDSDTDYDTDESSLFPYDGSYFLVDGTFVDEYYEDMDSDFYPPSDDEYMFDMLGYIPPLTRSQLRQFSHDDETEIITATNNNNTFRSRNSRRPNTRSSAPRKTRQIRSSLQSQQDNAAQTVRRSSRRSKRRPRI